MKDNNENDIYDFDIGERIRSVRIRKGITQRRLSEKLEVSPTMIAAYEAGTRTPKLSTLRKIANALDIDWYYLYTGLTLPEKEKTLCDDPDMNTLAYKALIHKFGSVAIHQETHGKLYEVKSEGASIYISESHFEKLNEALEASFNSMFDIIKDTSITMANDNEKFNHRKTRYEALMYEFDGREIKLKAELEEAKEKYDAAMRMFTKRENQLKAELKDTKEELRAAQSRVKIKAIPLNDIQETE